MGTIRNRNEILDHLGRLPATSQATDREVLFFIEQNRLPGRGIGYVDAHLLASAALSGGVLVWTLDRRLGEVAEAPILA